MVIEKDRILVENGNRAHGIGILDLRTFKPFAKNPPISKIFREIGFADELGSGMRNSYKYTKLYSGAKPEFIEGDVFEIIIPLKTGAMTKVGPGTSPVAGGEVGTQAEYASGTRVEYARSTHAGMQAERIDYTQKIKISLDVNKLNELLEYCSEPRTRAEMQDFCGIKTREYFRKNILAPMIQAGKLLLTIPEKPKSPNQKYYWKK